jgi:hypothetical protein
MIGRTIDGIVEGFGWKYEIDEVWMIQNLIAHAGSGFHDEKGVPEACRFYLCV